MLFNIARKKTEKIVGITRLFFEFTKINIQVTNTNNLYIKSDSAKFPAGKNIILPRRAARVE